MNEAPGFVFFFSGYLHDNRRAETQWADVQQSFYRSELCVAFHLCRRQVNQNTSTSYTFLKVQELVGEQDYTKSTVQISTKLGWRIGLGP